MQKFDPGAAPCGHALHIGRGLLAAAALVAIAGCHQGNRDATDITPSSTARGNTSGGGSTSTGQVSGATPIGQDLPQRETSTRTGPGTPNPGPGEGGSTASSGGAGSANASAGSSGTGGAGAAGAPGAGADSVGGSGTPIPPSAPGTPHVSASGAATESAGGIANAPGMAAGPNGRRATSEASPAAQR